jgi:hypothetical protein
MPKSVFQQLVEQTCSNPNFKPSNNKAVIPALAASSNGSVKSVTYSSQSVANPNGSRSGVNESRTTNHQSPDFKSPITNHKSPIAAPANAARPENQSAKSGRVEEANRAPRCMHVKANGVRCQSPAMRRQSFCFFHDRFYNPRYDDSFPPLEDANSVQCAILQVLNQLRYRVITVPEARTFLFGLKAASINARCTDFEPTHPQVTEMPYAEQARANAAAYEENPSELHSVANKKRENRNEKPAAKDVVIPSPGSPATPVLSCWGGRSHAEGTVAARKSPAPEVIPSAVEGSAFRAGQAFTPDKKEVAAMRTASSASSTTSGHKAPSPEVIPSERAARVEGSALEVARH